MDLRTVRAAPAALPALAVLAGTALGVGLGPGGVPVPLALALLAAAVALGRSAGLAAGGLAAGLLAAAVGAGSPDGPWPGIDPGRPVTAAGEVVEPWRRMEWGWRSELRLERLRQGRVVLGTPRRVAIELPGDEQPPPLGSRLRGRGYLGRPAGYANRIPLPPGPWRLRIKTRRLLEVVAPPGAVAVASGRLRGRVEEAIAAGGAANGGAGAPGHGPALARALVLGDPSELPPRWRRGLRRSGLAHLLAVSGLHAGLVAGVMLLVSAPLPRPARVVLALAAVIAYLAVVGPRPSMLRASGMALIAGTALVARRGPASANALAVVAAALALARPALAVDVGFRLTVAATAGIVFLAPRFEAAWTGGGEDEPAAAGSRGLRRTAARRLVRGLAATVAAQLASLPVALPVFHLTSWAAPLLNLAAVPYTALALAACLAWTALALASPAAAGSSVAALDALAAPFGWPAAGPLAAWGTVAAVAPPAACWLFAGLAAAWLLAPRRRWWLAPAAALAGLWCWLGGPAAGSPGRPPSGVPGGVSLTALDVGQGDAILLRGGGRALLVDGGGWRHGDFGARVLLPALLGEGVRRLDAVALTHPDADHCQGLAQVASYLPVGEVWLAPHWRAHPCAVELASAAPTVELAAGGARRLGGWRIAVLHPEWPGPRARAADPNSLSLVLRVEARGRCALLTGDLDQAGEREVLRRFGDLRCDFLKVGHHGSKSSTGRALLAALAPRLAVVSAGRGNPYGHPAGEVLDRLRRSGATVLRTDRHGLTRIAWTAGGALSIETPAAPPVEASD